QVRAEDAQDAGADDVCPPNEEGDAGKEIQERLQDSIMDSFETADNWSGGDWKIFLRIVDNFIVA
ncbi:MAG: hypothetical protein ABI669_12860, partial [Usitatibacter sp.]